MKDGHRFDIGATFLMMPGVYKEAFSAVGKNMSDELILYRMDPVYKVKFPGDRMQSGTQPEYTCPATGHAHLFPRIPGHIKHFGEQPVFR